MAYDLAKLHIDDLLREAEQERLAKQAAAGRAGHDPIDAVGFRERLSRLISGLPLIPAGPRLAGA